MLHVHVYFIIRIVALALLLPTTFLFHSCNSFLPITKSNSRINPLSSKNEQILFNSIPHFPHSQSSLFSSTTNNNNDSNNLDMLELSQRITNIKESNRIEEWNGEGGTINLPAISFDSLLPNQRLAGSTTDPTFCRFLRDVGLGGLFAMISLNNNQRKLRRNGVIVKITIVDAKQQQHDNDNFIPTSVDFELIGRRRCRVLGPSTGMKTRVGRWRRSYDQDGEESRLGWGEESFVDYCDDNHESSDVINKAENDYYDNNASHNLSNTEWSNNLIDCSFNDDDTDAIAISNDDSIVPFATESILPLLEKWYNLASNIKTYDNIDVTATSRAIHGYPGLRIDPKKLLHNIKLELGEQPKPQTSPTKFALWATALINPVPVPLGVSPEIRGRVLEAPNVKRKLEILKWGIERSMLNLNGTFPLC